MQAAVIIVFFVFVFVVPATMASIAITAVVLRRARFPERQQCQVGLTVHLPRGFREDSSLDPIHAFEFVPGKPVLRVLMIQRDGQFSYCVVLRPFTEKRSDSFDVLRVARGGDRLLGFGQRQIVNQAETVSLPQRANLVLAIGIEGREMRLKRAILNAAEIDRLFLTLVSDDELASFVG